MHSHILLKFVMFPFFGLNPCCNGRCTRTLFSFEKLVGLAAVLILVVMEDALAQTIKKQLDEEAVAS